MAMNEGEEVLDALLLLGYSIEIADDGTITATHGTDTLRGKAAMGTIEWSDRSAVYRARERAYLARLRAHVQTVQAANPDGVGSRQRRGTPSMVVPGER